jgi:hypothetical protein
MSAVILNKCFITFAELSKWLDPSSDDFTTVQASTLFDWRSGEERVYFESKSVEDYMRAAFNEHAPDLLTESMACSTLSLP